MKNGKSKRQVTETATPSRPSYPSISRELPALFYLPLRRYLGADGRPSAPFSPNPTRPSKHWQTRASAGVFN